MSDVMTKRCDNCGKAQDKDTNHWSRVSGRTHRDRTKEIWSGAFTYGPPFGGDTDHICIGDACGDECRFALMARYLATGSFVRKPAGVVCSRLNNDDVRIRISPAETPD